MSISHLFHCNTQVTSVKITVLVDQLQSIIFDTHIRSPSMMCYIWYVAYVRLQLSRINQKGINHVMHIIFLTVHGRIWPWMIWAIKHKGLFYGSYHHPLCQFSHSHKWTLTSTSDGFQLGSFIFSLFPHFYLIFSLYDASTIQC